MKLARSHADDHDRPRAVPGRPWRLVETSLGDDDGGLTGTLFATATATSGCAPTGRPIRESSGTYVNGFHETFPIVHAENAFGLARTGQSMLNAPEAKSIELRVGDEVLRLAPDRPERSTVHGLPALRSTSAPGCCDRS